MIKPQEKSLGELLRQAGKITSRQIQVALGEQKKTHEPIGKVLVRLGFVGEQDILQVMQGMMVLTFLTADERYGIETFRVREVLKYSPIQPSERLPQSWEGEAVLRGIPVPVLSFRRFLNFGDFPRKEGTWFIVLEKSKHPFILWVDQVKEVARVKIEQIEAVPPYLFGKKNELYYCLGKIKEELYSILNPDMLTDAQDFSLPDDEVDRANPQS